MTAQQILSFRSLRSEFTTLTLAEATRQNSVSFSKWSIILGDNGKFWVLSNRDAATLVKAGYEYAA